MKLVTGNDLVTGDVVWWTGQDWSRHVAEAIDAGADGEKIAHREEAALRVNVPYVIDAEPGRDGPAPVHIKERIRASGPTVRPDLAIAPTDPTVGSYVI
jgi:hypothetical protein